ncbi:MAG: hypothetical protein HYS17_09145 [Micavibrio aeruginosavorus]|uniref:Lipoprotein n=1 Tax=Micavibrio aeruginosavorus TaxID=349221 RepID=A0A7T5UFY9_9BACT|nr:MAG: hypothetical protein HYS17_09145 [Micavibrio aeruginosavorus]
MSLRSKFIIPALLSTAALVGCDDLPPPEVNAMEYAMTNLCVSKPTNSQKWACLAEGDTQAQYVAQTLEGRKVRLSDKLYDACYGTYVGKEGIPQTDDVLMTLQAGRIKECFAGLEAVAPADIKADVKRTAGYTYKGFQTVGL